MKKILLVASSFLGGILTGAGLNFKKIFKEKDDELLWQKRRADKNAVLIDIFASWMKIKQEGKSLKVYFEEKGYKKIAIYGMHYLGECLVRELKDSDIVIEYAIDRNAKGINSGIQCIDMSGEFTKVDAVIVTPVQSFFEIEEELSYKIECPIISIEDIIIYMR